MTISFDDFSALLILAFVTLFVAFPVKFSVSIIGGGSVSIVRSFMTMFIPVLLVVLLSNAFSAAFFFYPIFLIASIMILLEVGFIGAVGVSLISAAIYYFVITQFIAGTSIV